jgi:cation diffusion facilitator CzcD-associated flavoprotein CzcO
LIQVNATGVSLVNPSKSIEAAEPRSQAHFDVLFIGAGISGIGGACHLRAQLPQRTFAVLDEQDSFGGTWVTHRYPGIRSDSDMFTFGYRFKPWRGAPIASGAEILHYLGEVIEEHALRPHIRYRHKVLLASWSTPMARWTVEGVRTDTGERFAITANFLWMGQGYYRHDRGYMPQWPGVDDFRGELIHSQEWDAGTDFDGKRVLVIGSGATAATLIPALARRCSHVTMLQRSPTYFRCGPNVNELADLLRSLDVPDTWVHEIVRRKILADQRALVRRAFDDPQAVRDELLAGVREQLGSHELVERHFTPKYLPMRQRVAHVPDGDLFKAIRNGKASVVTDEIQRFEDTGVRTKSGELLKADLVVAATGIELVVMGGIEFSVDGKPVDFSREVLYRGAMFTGVPNLLWMFGYFRASWTLRVDLLADLFCRLLAHMEKIRVRQVTPRLRPQDAGMRFLPWVEETNFNPNYLRRVMDRMPRQGDRAPWHYTYDYWTDVDELAGADLDDGALVFGNGGTSATDLPIRDSQLAG